MSEEPDNLGLRRLRDIRATLDDHTNALARIEKQLASQAKVITYALGQTTETQFRQSEQEKRLDEVFDKLEELLSRPEPAQ